MARVKFVSDSGIEHEEFFEPIDSMFPSTGVLFQRIYDQLQEFDGKTLLHSDNWL